jgi:hypothetical protein
MTPDASASVVQEFYEQWNSGAMRNIGLSAMTSGRCLDACAT